MTPEPVTYPVYPTAGRCRHGRNPCPDFWCGIAGREAGKQPMTAPEIGRDLDATPAQPPT